MDIGVGLDIVNVETGKAVPLSALADQAQRAEGLGYSSVWVNDHFWWMEYNGHRLGGHEALTSLAFVAGRTERVELGTLVLCNSFRHPAQLAREAVAIADASNGRLIAGLGAGWNAAEYKALGLAADHLTSRLEEALAIFTPLIHKGRVSFSGRYYEVDDVIVQTVVSPPRLWLGTTSPWTLRMAAQHADGWNWSLPWTPASSETFRALASSFLSEVEAAGRRREDVVVSANMLVIVVEDEAGRSAALKRAKGMLGEFPVELVVIATVNELPGIVAQIEADGVDHLVLSLSPVPFSVFDPHQLERAAETLNLGEHRR